MILALVCFSTRCRSRHLGAFVDVSNDLYIYILISPTIFVVLVRALYNLEVKVE
jgi:hypothetical protein